ncbi:alpha-galactosidase [Kiritimatiellaeota bacterium B1221]|nr:alpha-galactosidase [Kiritimatiellaeota bacterium B1221]
MSILPEISCAFENATVTTDQDRLIVSTGRMQRIWQWTDQGLVTREVSDLSSGRSWVNQAEKCDWQLPDGSEASGAEMPILQARVQDDGGFTRQHICVRAEIPYPAQGLTLQCTVWAYPHAPGIRTQLAARWDVPPAASSEPRRQGKPFPARNEQVPLGPSPQRRRFFGYYNDTQRRNDTHQNLLKEEVIDHPLQGSEWCDWANAACVEDADGGIALVKESHKCVNKAGHDTGGFICDRTQGLSCSGWGLHPEEISSEGFTAGWATWCLVWSGGDLAREITFKTFDRLRFPIDPARDIYIQANTWGSTETSADARRAACQPSVMQEIDTCAELGIDVLQIDDGWQVPPGNSSWDPQANGWHPHPESHPGGWAPLRGHAKARGVKLGLWAAATPISLDELKANYTEGGFVQYKLDFADLRCRSEIDSLMQKVRDFISWTDHKVRVNWDVTENEPRYGYFFAREYGCIFLENRKPLRPQNVIYRPHTVLRDLWQVAKYLNPHRFQCVIQNVDRVSQDFSDAHLHSHAYAVAIALMGIPLFFQETKYYTVEAKKEIAPLLALYKKQREVIYGGIVHPLGDPPDNASWTGFQSHLPDENRGTLLIFRERCNAQTEAELQMGWLSNCQIEMTDLVQQSTEVKTVGSDGRVTFKIDQAPGFLFLSYTISG